jgi:hypothetical protein
MLGSGTNTDMEKSKAKFRYKKPAFLWLVTPQEIFLNLLIAKSIFNKHQL